MREITETDKKFMLLVLRLLLWIAYGQHYPDRKDFDTKTDEHFRKLSDDVNAFIDDL